MAGEPQKRRIELFGLTLMLLPVLLVSGAALWWSYKDSSHLSRSLTAFVADAMRLRHGRDYLNAFLGFQTGLLFVVFVLLVFCLFLQFMLDRVPMPFDLPDRLPDRDNEK